MAYVEDHVIDRLDRFFARVRRTAEAIPGVERSILPEELHASYLIFAKMAAEKEAQYLGARVVVDRAWKDPETILAIYKSLSPFFGETAYRTARDIHIRTRVERTLSELPLASERKSLTTMLETFFHRQRNIPAGKAHEERGMQRAFLYVLKKSAQASDETYMMIAYLLDGLLTRDDTFVYYQLLTLILDRELYTPEEDPAAAKRVLVQATAQLHGMHLKAHQEDGGFYDDCGIIGANLDKLVKRVQNAFPESAHLLA